MYDIRSYNFDENGKEKEIFIEVKTTDSNIKNAFFISKNEYETKLVKELYSGENGQIFQMMQFFYFCNALYDIDELNKFFEQMFEDCKNNSQILAKILFS